MPEIAALINEHFVAVKVDRDERPDVDARYQAAVSAISGQGGWPLTAFLTPDGRPYFGGTYIPRDDRYGRPGMGRVLLAMAQVWRERRDEALETAGSVMAAIEHNESFSGRGGALNLALVGQDCRVDCCAVRSAQWRLRLAAQVSASRGARSAAGSGDEPRQRAAREAFTTTLEKMARGGVYDQLAGGFHRYSVDERWVVPHFEKMLYDNTELLRNYVHGYQSFVRDDFLLIAREIVAWLDATMTDRERGGFYAFAGCRCRPGRRRRLLYLDAGRSARRSRREELEFAAKYWDIGELGDMHHNPAKNVLHVKQTLAEMAAQSGWLTKNLCVRCATRRAPNCWPRASQAAHALCRSHALHRLECDGGDGVPGDGARAAHGSGAGVRAAHARPAAGRGLGRGCRRCSHVIAYPDGRQAAGECARARSTITHSP